MQKYLAYLKTCIDCFFLYMLYYICLIILFGGILSSLKNIERIELEPYHNFGVDKYKNLCMDYLCNDVGVPTEDEKQSWVKIIKAFTDVSVKCF